LNLEVKNMIVLGKFDVNGKGVDLVLLYDYLKELGVDVRYDPEVFNHFSGLIYREQRDDGKHRSIVVFKNGKFTIAGVRSLEEAEDLAKRMWSYIEEVTP